jgi:hypothetical protein
MHTVGKSKGPHVHEVEIEGRTWRILVSPEAEGEAIARHADDIAVITPLPDSTLDGSSLSNGPEAFAVLGALVDADIERAAALKIASEGLTDSEVTLTASEIASLLGWNDEA